MMYAAMFLRPIQDNARVPLYTPSNCYVLTPIAGRGYRGFPSRHLVGTSVNKEGSGS